MLILCFFKFFFIYVMCLWMDWIWSKDIYVLYVYFFILRIIIWLINYWRLYEINDLIFCFRKSYCVWLYVGCVLLCIDFDSYGNFWRKYLVCGIFINLLGKLCLMVNIMRIFWIYLVVIKVLFKLFIYICVRYDDFKNVFY